MQNSKLFTTLSKLLCNMAKLNKFNYFLNSTED